MKELLEAGVHFGHQVRRWNPKMKEYIFGERNGIYIIDLQKTQRMFRDAISFMTNLMAEKHGRTVLFVGTKRQAQDAIREEALRAGQFYVNQRWLGGLLTNFQTVQKSIKRFKDLESMQSDGRYEKLTKKERLQLDREREKLEKNLSGIKNMARLPDVIFVIDVRKEEIAIAEANHLGIPIVAVVDTNCSPEGVDHIIPGNDDALRAVRLFASRIADAILEGQQMLQMEDEEEISGEDIAASDDTGSNGNGARRRRTRTDAVAATNEFVVETPNAEAVATVVGSAENIEDTGSDSSPESAMNIAPEITEPDETTEEMATDGATVDETENRSSRELPETATAQLPYESGESSEEPEELMLEAIGSVRNAG